MGLNIVLQDEWGGHIANVVDPQDLLAHLLPPATDAESRCLKYVDWYGDTVFNKLQMPDLLADLERIAVAARTDAERQLVRQIVELAHRCRDGIGLYIKFIGE